MTAACCSQAFLAAGRAGEAVGLPVRGGLWEVDLAARRMACAYWPEPAHRVARGTWFLEKGADWVPLKVGSTLQAASEGSMPWHCFRVGGSPGAFHAKHVRTRRPVLTGRCMTRGTAGGYCTVQQRSLMMMLDLVSRLACVSREHWPTAGC